MKRIAASLLLTGLGFMACHKESTTPPPTSTNPPTYSTYGSIQSFYAQNGVPMQYYTVNGATGGSFTTPQGTKVTVPGNCFIDNLSNPVTGTVTIEFKDIYTKSDMLLSNMPPQLPNGPLKSGGEFFIRAKSGGNAIYLVNKPIQISQPLNGWASDNKMLAFNTRVDSFGNSNWASSLDDSIHDNITGYIFSLYSFGNPVDSGTWCNSDNPSYFSAYTQTSLTMKTTDSVNSTYTSVFLLFKGLNSMVHVYWNGGTFPYNYAPLGLQCTVAVFEIMPNGQFRAAFVPTTITANGTVNFSCTPTTTAAFKAQLSTYNH
jgi:hypothetical protein